MDVVLAPKALTAFIRRVEAEGGERYRDFAWRRTDDPYAILVSEVMLQQTQVLRVERYFESWIAQFPTIDALAAASVSDVLEAWQGLGYNRRALMLKRASEIISEEYAGEVPTTYDELVALPGIGPATAAGILAFSQNLPAPYLETNVRAVVLFEIFPQDEAVGDREIKAVLVQAAQRSVEMGIEPRDWNYALLDYGAWLKKTVPNPSRRSKHHTRQSTFEGSRRQKRAALLRAVMTAPDQTAATYTEMLRGDLNAEIDLVEDILNDLTEEGFLSRTEEHYRVAR
ncbi:MAG: adenine glycosylase [Coriobacteriia bacterium]|nr:adenine glycosylase [Coriobacteriia bacterium]